MAKQPSRSSLAPVSESPPAASSVRSASPATAEARSPVASGVAGAAKTSRPPLISDELQAKLREAMGYTEDDFDEGENTGAESRARSERSSERGDSADDADTESPRSDARGGEGEAGEGDQGDAQDDARATPASLAELADRLGVEASELYDLEIPLGGDQVMTLGELKDAAKGAVDLKAERLQFVAESERKADEIEKARGELGRIMALVPRELLTPQVLAKVRGEAEREMGEQWGRLLQAVPEWRDAKRYETDFSEMAKVAESVGYTRRELEQVTDHRAYRLLLKLTRLTKAVDGALGGMKAREKRAGGDAPARSRRGEKSGEAEARRRNMASRGFEGRVMAINEILNE